MEIIRSLDHYPAAGQGGAVAIGNFDGVHRGHAQLIARLRSWADEVGGPAIVFTFDPHPVRILRPDETPPPLTWTERKAELLAEQGVDLLIAYPASKELLQMTYVEFFDAIIVRGLAARAMVEGPNFLFGKDRQGDVQKLGELCQNAGLSLEIVEPLLDHHAMISSSRIRELVKEGDVDQASAMLTRPYRVRGLVTHGDGRGAQLGFPTANVDGVDTLIPGPGVYAGLACLRDQVHQAAIHVGPNPTFGQQALKIEAHLLEFNGSLYGEPLELEFHKRLRGVVRFESADQLQAQIRRDLDSLRAWAASLSDGTVDAARDSQA